MTTCFNLHQRSLYIAVAALTLAGASCASSSDSSDSARTNASEMSSIQEAAEGNGDDGTSSTTVPLVPPVGVIRSPALEVGDQSLPNVTADPEDPPDFELRANQGDLLVVYFGFTMCPDVCPTTLSDLQLAIAEAEGSDRIQVAMATVDPERDSAEQLSQYVGFFTDDRGVALRTDDFDQLHAVEDAFLTRSELIDLGAEATEAVPYDVVHSGALYLIDERGTVVVEWPFGTSTEAMTTDLDHFLPR